MYVFNEGTFGYSTVMKACKRVETKIKKDPDYKLAVDKLKQKLGTM